MIVVVISEIIFFCFQDNLSRIFKFTNLETFLFVFVHDGQKFMRRQQFVSVCPRQFNCIRVWSRGGQLRVPYFRLARDQRRSFDASTSQECGLIFF
jgi:hypothetical protein